MNILCGNFNSSGNQCFFFFNVREFKIYLNWIVQANSALLTGKRGRKYCFNSSFQNMLVKCKVSMRKNTFHTFRKPESFFLTSRFITPSFLQTRMSCHCLWGNFLYGHFCLLRFSTLIRLGRSKIRNLGRIYCSSRFEGSPQDNPSS